QGDAAPVAASWRNSGGGRAESPRPASCTVELMRPTLSALQQGAEIGIGVDAIFVLHSAAAIAGQPFRAARKADIVTLLAKARRGFRPACANPDTGEREPHCQGDDQLLHP